MKKDVEKDEKCCKVHWLEREEWVVVHRNWPLRHLNGQSLFVLLSVFVLYYRVVQHLIHFISISSTTCTSCSDLSACDFLKIFRIISIISHDFLHFILS